MIVSVIKEHFKGGAVMDIGAWMEFETEHAASVAGIVEERPPAAGEFLEGFIDQTRRPLRPGVDHVPGKSAGEDGNVAQA